jgi:hypothetical protein
MRRLILTLALVLTLTAPLGAALETSQEAVQPLSLTYAFCDTALASDVKLIDVTGYVEVITFWSDQACSVKYIARSNADHSAPTNCCRIGAGAVFTIANEDGIDSLYIYNESGSEANHCVLGERR